MHSSYIIYESLKRYIKGLNDKDEAVMGTGYSVILEGEISQDSHTRSYIITIIIIIIISYKNAKNCSNGKKRRRIEKGGGGKTRKLFLNIHTRAGSMRG